MSIAEEMKAAILQAAIQGKLTEQRKEDGDARDLLLEIQEEKQKLIAEKKIKREKPLPPIEEDEVPFALPENWRWVRINEIYNFIDYRGITPNKSTKGIFLITASNIRRGYLNFDRTEYISEESYAVRQMRGITKKGDLVFTTEAPMGNIAINPLDHVSCGQRVITFQQYKDDTLNNLNFCFFIMSPMFQEFLRKEATGTTAKGIKAQKLKKLLLPLPPLAEQKRIVAKVDALLAEVEDLAKAENELAALKAHFPKDMKAALLQAAIQGKLTEQRKEDGDARDLLREIQKEKQKLMAEKKIKREKPLPSIEGDEVPFALPENWCWVRLGNIAFVTKLAGFEYTKYIYPNLVNKGIPLFKGKNIQNGKLLLRFESYISEQVSNELVRSQITKKCLLTPYVGTIGNIAIFDGRFKAHLGSNVGKIEIFNSNAMHVLEEYVLYYLQGPEGLTQLSKYKKATAQESISIQAIRDVFFPLPPLAEQKRIVSKLDRLLPLCDELE